MRLWLILFSCILLVGCRSTEHAKPALASVTFKGNTPGQISYAVDRAFAAHGYSVAHTGPYTMLFERKGSTGSNILYGNWTGDTPVWIRVKAQLVPLEPEVFRIDCTAYRVRDRGKTLEEEIPFGAMNRGHF